MVNTPKGAQVHASFIGNPKYILVLLVREPFLCLRFLSRLLTGQASSSIIINWQFIMTRFVDTGKYTLCNFTHHKLWLCYNLKGIRIERHSLNSGDSTLMKPLGTGTKFNLGCVSSHRDNIPQRKHLENWE